MIIYAMITLVRRSETLDAETAFTVVAILGLVTHPANMVMTIYPRIVACFASFERIQAYLLDSNHQDSRVVPWRDFRNEDVAHPRSTIQLVHSTVNPSGRSRPVLENINLNIERGQVIICAGAIGSGKSALAKVILGELPADSGRVQVNSNRIGFCAQAAWLPSGTIREVICGSDSKDRNLQYLEAVTACCLDHDIESFMDGDQTNVGSRGMNLSGGQRQRLVSPCYLLKTNEFDVTGSCTRGVQSHRYDHPGRSIQCT
jgi:ATP-binding cassette subfamily C (CFTR/MRP) protein 1